MNATFLIEQLLNGLGYGLMLFMLAAGLTLVFGVMDTMNLAHGTLYMLGAYFAAETYARSQSFLLALVESATQPWERTAAIQLAARTGRPENPVWVARRAGVADRLSRCHRWARVSAPPMTTKVAPVIRLKMRPWRPSQGATRIAMPAISSS